MFLHITDAKYVGQYKVEVFFNDGRHGIVDLSGVLCGPVFDPLKDKAVFAQLKVSRELDTIVWPTGVDLSPEYVYFQAFKDEPELQGLFRKWGYLN